MSATINEVSDATFQREVLESNVPTLVDFWAPWCMPCRMMAPILEEFQQKNGERVKVVKLNTDENQSIAAKYGIMSIPSLLIFKDGEEKVRTVGVQPVGALEEELDKII